MSNRTRIFTPTARRSWRVFGPAAALAALAALALAGPARTGPTAKEVFPRVQVVPMPDDQASFQADGLERLRYYYPARFNRPYWFPLIGPAGRPLTRIAHPHDPNGHSHHKSIWVAHEKVNGRSFWSDRAETRIVHDRSISYEDGTDSATMVVQNRWLDETGRRLLTEIRSARLIPLAEGEVAMDIGLTLQATDGPVTFGATPFGFLGARVAKTMGVHDGGGVLRNSEGAVGEEAVIWKRARWVDYSGPIAPGVENGLTLMDHPANPRHPSYFHVRSDGWMGASFCYETTATLAAGEELSLRYRLYGHRGGMSAERIEEAWKRFAAR